MRAPQDTSFEDRLSHWIAAQGFWFQLRHSTGKSLAAKLAGRLLSVAVRLLLVVVVCVVVAAIYLVKRVESASFREGLKESSAAALGAESAKVTGFQRQRGMVFIHRFEAKGGQGTFFSRLEARGVRYKMGMFDGLAGEWDAGPVTVTAARIEAKAGVADEEEGTAVSEGLFGAHDWFKFPLVEVLDATVLWGYSERTRGMIQGSHLVIQEEENGWRLRFRGGRFTQNWLKRLEIDELVAILKPGMLEIESSRMRSEQGTLLLSGKVIGGVRPELALAATFENLPLRPILPPEARGFAEGTISGTAKVGGSTNSQVGVTFDCEVVLGSADEVVLRDRLPLLQALTVVDLLNSYRKVPLTVGSFTIRTGGGELSVADLQLEASGLMVLSGGMKVRPPNEEEIARALTTGPRGLDSSLLQALTDEAAERGEEVDDKDAEFTLRRAAEATNRDEEETGPSLALGPGGMMPMSIQEQARDRHARMLRFEGGFLMEIPGGAFERAQKLREEHPADPGSGRVPLEVPLSGTLFELTVEQAEGIYLKGKRGG